MQSKYSLYKYSVELLMEIENIIESGGEVTDHYDRLIQKYPDAMSQLCEIVKFAKQNVVAAKQRIEEIEKIAKQNENLEDFAKKVILNLMPVMGEKTKSGGYSYKTHDHSIHTRSGSKSVMVEDATMVPNEFIETNIVQRVRKDKVGELLKEGKEVPGCKLVTGDVVVIIK